MSQAITLPPEFEFFRKVRDFTPAEKKSLAPLLKQYHDWRKRHGIKKMRGKRSAVAARERSAAAARDETAILGLFAEWGERQSPPFILRQLDTSEERRQELVTMLCPAPQLSEERSDRPGEMRLNVIPGGFEYRGVPYNLSGRPLAMLTILLASRHHRCTAQHLINEMEADSGTDQPDAVIRDTAKQLRRALRRPARLADPNCDDPLPHFGQGTDLAYGLNMP
jgi:hypothetical protein